MKSQGRPTVTDASRVTQMLRMPYNGTVGGILQGGWE